MSLIQTVSPFMSPHDRGYIDHNTTSKRSNNQASTPKISPDIGMHFNDREDNKAKKEKYGEEDVAMDGNSPDIYPKTDPFLAQYMKPQVKSSLNNHQIYFRSLDEQRKIKLLEIYQKYLIHTDDFKKQTTKHIENLNHKLRHENERIPIISTERQLEKTEDQENKTQTPINVSPSAMIAPMVKSESPTRVHRQTTKRLPKEFMDCSLDDLINLISRMLKLLITLNDKNVPQSISHPQEKSSSSNRVLTRYHSRTPPGISTHTYLSRLTKFNNFTSATLLTTIYYIDLLSHHYQPFFTLNSWTVHRFLLVATMLSQKLMEDFFYTNDHYAKVGGVAVGELNCLELDFLNRVDWKCVPAKQLENGKSSIKYAKNVLDLYYGQLIQLMGKNTSRSDELLYFSCEDESYYKEKGEEIVEERENSDRDDDDDEEDDDEYEEDEDDDDYGSPTILNPSVHEQKYNFKGFSVDNSSSPHLKRRYSTNFGD